jgi:hypothetical protein
MGRHRPIRRTDRHQPRHRTFHRHESGKLFVPARTTVHVAGQVDRRVPAARHCQAVGLDLEGLGPLAHGDRRQPQPPPAADNLGPHMHRAILDAEGIRARINDCGHLNARRHQLARRRPCLIGVGKQGHALAGADAISVKVGPDRRGQHDPRPVVVLERHRPLQRAAGQDGMRCNDPPKAFARQVGARRLVQAHPLQRAISAVVIGPGHRRPQHDPHVRQRLQFGHRLRHPVALRHPADGPVLGQKPPAQGMAFLSQDDIRTRAASSQGRHQACRTRTDTRTSQKAKAFS